jgi:cytochrome c peroxidase
MRTFISAVILLLVFAFSLKKTEFFIPKNWPKPVYNFDNNPLSKQKILLGRTLFYDPILSKNNTVSCASCHSPFSGFAHTDHALSHGIGDSIGNRNSLALVNLAWQSSFMWDGAINSLDMQALAPISHPAEMGSNIVEVVEKLNQSPKYKKLFYKSFNDSVATGEKTLKVISQFLLSLISCNSKYDKVIRRQAKFTVQEANGYFLFKKNCATCHKEPLFTTNEFANNGLPVDTLLNDFGKIRITKNADDSLKFKIPSLRNVEFTYPYMHDGRFKKLSDVLNHYTKGPHHSNTLAKELREPLMLSSNEKVDVIAFLLTLSDKEFIFNKEHGFVD